MQTVPPSGGHNCHLHDGPGCPRGPAKAVFHAWPPERQPAGGDGPNGQCSATRAACLTR